MQDEGIVVNCGRQGYGWIGRGVGIPPIWFHVNDTPGLIARKSLIGKRVSFELIFTKRGERAVDVQLID